MRPDKCFISHTVARITGNQRLEYAAQFDIQEASDRAPTGHLVEPDARWKIQRQQIGISRYVHSHRFFHEDVCGS
jgi:hypothetical protein